MAHQSPYLNNIDADVIPRYNCLYIPRYWILLVFETLLVVLYSINDFCQIKTHKVNDGTIPC